MANSLLHCSEMPSTNTSSFELRDISKTPLVHVHSLLPHEFIDVVSALERYFDHHKITEDSSKIATAISCFTSSDSHDYFRCHTDSWDDLEWSDVFHDDGTLSKEGFVTLVMDEICGVDWKMSEYKSMMALRQQDVPDRSFKRFANRLCAKNSILSGFSFHLGDDSVKVTLRNGMDDSFRHYLDSQKVDGSLPLKEWVAAAVACEPPYIALMRTMNPDFGKARSGSGQQKRPAGSDISQRPNKFAGVGSRPSGSQTGWPLAKLSPVVRELMVATNGCFKCQMANAGHSGRDCPNSHVRLSCPPRDPTPEEIRRVHQHCQQHPEQSIPMDVIIKNRTATPSVPRRPVAAITSVATSLDDFIPAPVAASVPATSATSASAPPSTYPFVSGPDVYSQQPFVAAVAPPTTISSISQRRVPAAESGNVSEDDSWSESEDDLPQHGTYERYQDGCRCKDCSCEWMVQELKYQKKKRFAAEDKLDAAKKTDSASSAPVSATVTETMAASSSDKSISDPQASDVSGVIHPLRVDHLWWDCRLPGSLLPSRVLIDTGSHIVLIRRDLVNALDLTIRKLPRPEPIAVAMTDGPPKTFLLDSFVNISLGDTSLSWRSHTFSAIISDTLCAPMIIGLPFLAANSLVIDPSARSIVDTSSGFDILNPIMRYPPPPVMSPPVRRKKDRVAFKDQVRDYRKNVLPALAKDVRFRAAADVESASRVSTSSAYGYNVVAAIRMRVDKLQERNEWSSRSAALKERFSDVFESIPHADALPTEILCDIKLKHAFTTVKSRGYSSPKKYKDAWSVLIQKHLDAGRIQPSSSSVFSPAFLIPKSDPSALPRWVNDFRALNACTVPDRGPLVRIDSILADCRGKVFGKMDMTDSFFKQGWNLAQSP